MLNISVIILTYNEKIHIERCIKNAKKFAKDIYLVDCFSNDGTVEIAEALGAKVFQHPWEIIQNSLTGLYKIYRLLQNGYGVWMLMNIYPTI